VKLFKGHHADLEFAHARGADFIDGDAQRGVVAEVRVDPQQASPAGALRPVGDLADGRDEGLVRAGKSENVPGPLSAWPTETV